MTTATTEALSPSPPMGGDRPALPPATVIERAQSRNMYGIRSASVLFDGSIGVGYNPEDIGCKADTPNYRAEVIGEFALPGEDDVRNLHVAVMRVVSKSDGDVRFALQGLVVGDDGKAAKSSPPLILLSDNPTVIGGDPSRGSGNGQRLRAEQLWGEGALYPGSVSPEHVQLRVEGDGVLLRDTSIYGTWVSRNAVDDPESSGYVAEHTMLNYRHARLRGYIDADGKFAGRDIISRDTTMGGSKPEATVDIRALSGGGEATVVDAVNAGEIEKQGYKKLEDRYNEKLQRLRAAEGDLVESGSVARLIYDTVRESIGYDSDYADSVAAHVRESSTTGTNKVNLGWYLNDGKGVCRHMALAAAWLGGGAAERGELTGRVTAEVNQRLEDNSAHEWARFTDSFGEVYIIDPAHGYFGRLKDSLDLTSDENKRWYYFRDDERKLMEARIATERAQRGKIITEVPGFPS